MKEKLNHACKGAILGALLSAVALWWVDDINWLYVGIISLACAVVSYINGEGFILWLRQLWYNVWND